MTINRIARLTTEQEGEGAPRAGTYWVLRTESGWFYLDPPTAMRIQRIIRRWWGPRWLTFTDRAGSRACIRRADVRTLDESTPATRAEERRLEMALEQEQKEQRPPWMEGL